MVPIVHIIKVAKITHCNTSLENTSKQEPVSWNTKTILENLLLCEGEKVCL